MSDALSCILYVNKLKLIDMKKGAQPYHSHRRCTISQTILCIVNRIILKDCVLTTGLERHDKT